MDEFVFIDGKKYRRGYTTGSAATAGCKSCLKMLITKKIIDKVSISTPNKIDLNIDVYDPVIKEASIQCRIVKDGGDDIDATHNMDICVRLEVVDLYDEVDYKCDIDIYKVEITGGVGIGRVTKKGLSTDVGRPSINSVPLKMIKNEIESILDEYDCSIDDIIGSNKKIRFTIYAPRGEEVSVHTFNPNLGIEGGISIIGTTGIVEPMSDEGWKKALSAELSIKKEEGYNEIILTPGNIGYETMRDVFNVDENKIVKMSNFIGYMLMESKRLGFRKIVIAGHIGKLIKLSGGITNTHSRVSDARKEIMIANLALMGGHLEVLKKVDKCLTTDAMLPIIEENGMEDVYYILCKKAAQNAWKYIRDVEGIIEVEVIMFSMDRKALSRASYNNK